MNRLDNVEQTQLRENIPGFQSGDTVKVHVRIKEGNKERLQVFEGIVIAAGNLLYTVASVVVVLADVCPLTTTGVVLTLAGGVYTLVMAELQYQGWRRAKA